jgi:lysophospholipid acyltransferase (LPLAT)-like uncharacterized protein
MTESAPKKIKRSKGLLRRALRPVLRRTRESALPWTVGGKIGAAYMRLVRATTPLTFEPGNPFEIYADRAPLILTGWHGQHFMVTFLMRHGDRARALVSRSRDGDASAAFMGSFGIEAIRGSGGRNRKRSIEKGGARAFLQLKKSLDEGVSIATIADISNSVARRCGEGVIALARASGRPIVAMGFATSRWIELKSWDRATIHLPFSRGACVVAEPVEVPRHADEALMEAKRVEVEARINAAMARAYEIVGRQRI